MSGHKILAPHGQQDGWVYVRMPKSILSSEPTRTAPDDDPLDVIDVVDEDGDVYLIDIAYFDDRPGSRIISSRRAEQDVETGDFLRLCAQEVLDAVLRGSGASSEWYVVDNVQCGGIIPQDPDIPFGSGATLREAYYRYHAEADAE